MKILLLCSIPLYNSQHIIYPFFYEWPFELLDPVLDSLIQSSFYFLDIIALAIYICISNFLLFSLLFSFNTKREERNHRKIILKFQDFKGGLLQWLKWQRVCLQCRRPGFSPWVGKIPWRKQWQPTPVLLPRESHEQRRLTGF